MNKEKLLEVADAIEKSKIPDLGFNMARFHDDGRLGLVDKSGNECGTVCCIAGWVCALNKGVDEKNVPNVAYSDMPIVAREILGLDMHDARNLFFGGPIGHLSGITQENAVRTIRNLVETGEVDWFA